MEILKGMYGLPQAGILANKLLKKRLAKHDTLNNRTPLAYGDTNPIQYGSTWLLMILGSSILAKATFNTSTMPSGKKYEIIEDCAGKLY